MTKLKRYRLDQLERRIALGASYHAEENIIFDDGLGGYMGINTPKKRLDKLCSLTGVSSKPLHSTRHSYTTRLFENGVAPKAVQDLLGHEKMEYTMEIYTRVMRDTKDQAVEKIDSLFI